MIVNLSCIEFCKTCPEKWDFFATYTSNSYYCNKVKWTFHHARDDGAVESVTGLLH